MFCDGSFSSESVRPVRCNRFSVRAILAVWCVLLVSFCHVPAAWGGTCTWVGLLGEGEPGPWYVNPNPLDTDNSPWECDPSIYGYPNIIPFPILVSFDAEIGGMGTTAVVVPPILPIGIANLTLTNGSTLQLIDGSEFRLENTGEGSSVTSDGVIRLSSGEVLNTDLLLDGHVTFSGGGVVELGDSMSNVIGGMVGGFNFTHTLDIADHTVRGAGVLGNNQLSIINQTDGLIEANGTNKLIIEPDDNGNLVNQDASLKSS